jgi:hypothetical protein
MFDAMFSGRFPLPTVPAVSSATNEADPLAGAVFIDRDGALFEFVVQL